jgi:hypothetical protein
MLLSGGLILSAAPAAAQAVTCRATSGMAYFDRPFGTQRGVIDGAIAVSIRMMERRRDGEWVLIESAAKADDLGWVPAALLTYCQRRSS